MRVVVSAAVTLLAFAFTAVPAEAMQLFVLTLEGNHFTFEVEPTDLVEDVKTQVSRKTGIPRRSDCAGLRRSRAPRRQYP